MSSPLDILAIAAHRDDVEQTCGGTILKMAQRGHRIGILDLTQGEMGTRGTSEDRANEAADAARIFDKVHQGNILVAAGNLRRRVSPRLAQRTGGVHRGCVDLAMSL